jgi:hypothetical protein
VANNADNTNLRLLERRLQRGKESVNITFLAAPAAGYRDRGCQQDVMMMMIRCFFCAVPHFNAAFLSIAVLSAIH